MIPSLSAQEFLISNQTVLRQVQLVTALLETMEYQFCFILDQQVIYVQEKVTGPEFCSPISALILCACRGGRKMHTSSIAFIGVTHKELYLNLTPFWAESLILCNLNYLNYFLIINIIIY